MISLWQKNLTNHLTHQSDSKTTLHPFHIVEVRPWPLTGSLAACIIMFSFTNWFHFDHNPLIPLIPLPIILLTIITWWRDVLRESTYLGFHTYKVRRGLEWGIILFITSEIIFFSAFFWAFFHSALSPTHDLGCIWPPIRLSPLNPFAIPLLNTAVLLTSGATVTFAHHRLINSNLINTLEGLSFTVLLGAWFTYLQISEYLDTEFRFADRVYGSTFFIATGFHGLHVLIGTLFLLTRLVRTLTLHLSALYHFGLEAAAWYWHFVDVVWLFLFIILYWWATP